MSVLDVKDIDMFYGDSHVLFGVSFNVLEREVVCLLGRNGVGKTSTFRALMGVNPVRSGRISFLGQEIAKKPPFTIATLGMGYVPEDKRLFPSLSVKENLEIGAGNRHSPHGEIQQWTLQRVYEYFPILEKRQNHSGVQLSGGEQQMLAIGRALMTNPRLLLLDEPSQGLAPILQRELGRLVLKISGEGLTILLAEQSLTVAMSVLSRAYVLEKGCIRYEGKIEDFKDNRGILEHYLGV